MGEIGSEETWWGGGGVNKTSLRATDRCVLVTRVSLVCPPHVLTVILSHLGDKKEQDLNFHF